MPRVFNWNVAFAVATLVGTIVGAGIFGLPSVISRAGFFIGALYIFGFGAIITVVHLAYGEMVLRTEGRHRLVGYVARYLGDWARPFISAASLFSLEGTLLAYTILGGQFLAVLAGPWVGGTGDSWSVAFFIAGAVVIWRGLRLVGLVELVFDVLFIGALLVVVGASFPAMRGEHFVGLSGSFSSLVASFGVVLFTLAGWIAIPDLRELLGGRGRALRAAIIAGSLVAVVLTALFVFAVVGVTGAATTADALSGLETFVGKPVVVAGALFGLLAVATSFFVIGNGAREIFEYDVRMSRVAAFAGALLPPLAAFFYVTKNFIAVLGAVGVLSALLEGSAILLSYLRARRLGERTPEYELGLPAGVAYAMIALFACGAAAHFLFVR